MALSANVERILQEVEALSAFEHEELMGVLGFSDEEEISGEWREEIERRVKEIDDGMVDLIPHEEVMGNLRANLAGLRRAHA